MRFLIIVCAALISCSRDPENSKVVQNSNDWELPESETTSLPEVIPNSSQKPPTDVLNPYAEPEQNRIIKDMAVKARLHCRVDEEDGREYCFDPEIEMPSDLDPTQKVPSCKNGLLDLGECKPVTIKMNLGSFQLFAGETLKISRELREDTHYFKLRKTAYGYLSYDFPSRFTAPSVELFTISDDSTYLIINSNEYIEFNIGTYVLKMGPVKLKDFREVCLNISKIIVSDRDNPYSESRSSYGGEYSLGCHVGPRDRINFSADCDTNGQFCKINELHWRNN